MTEIRSAIIVFAVIGVIITGVSIYFNSIQTGNNISFESVIIDDSSTKINKLNFPKAPELRGINGYINTEPLTITDLEGKVIIVDFWTYTCINCIRTIPYLNAWHEKYSDDGLVILGVHAPEFNFEKDYKNLKAAVEKFEIKYPVLQDNEMSTWKAYKNNFWPHKYIIDHEGFIRYDHIGEGAYEKTESIIQELLNERSISFGINIDITKDMVSPDETIDVNFSKIHTREIYLGYDFGSELGNKEELIQNKITSFSVVENIIPNKVYLEGTWKNNRDHVELMSETGKVFLNYNAKAVNIVAVGDSILMVKLDNTLINNSISGKDVNNSKVRILEERMYNLVFNEGYGKHLIEMELKGKGFKLYTFTFG